VRFQIKLSARDRGQLEELLSGGLQSVRTTLRALALRQMDLGWFRQLDLAPFDGLNWPHLEGM
jgi:hypothetical protein